MQATRRRDLRNGRRERTDLEVHFMNGFLICLSARQIPPLPFFFLTRSFFFIILLLLKQLLVSIKKKRRAL